MLIRISEKTKKNLEYLRDEGNHRSIDKVITKLQNNGEKTSVGLKFDLVERIIPTTIAINDIPWRRTPKNIKPLETVYVAAEIPKCCDGEIDFWLQLMFRKAFLAILRKVSEYISEPNPIFVIRTHIDGKSVLFFYSIYPKTAKIKE